MSDEKAGPTGKFPRGQITEDDKGELAISFRVSAGMNNQAVIIMDFGAETSWIGLEPDMIDGLCETLQSAKRQALRLQAKYGASS
jgi:hypothetical protein